MSDLLQDFETYFTSLSLITEGAFFRDSSPDSPDSAVTIYEYSGSNPLPQIASVHRSIQIVARDKNPTAAKLKARQLYATLKDENGIISLTEGRWCMVHLRQVPFKIRTDSSERHYYGFNLGVTTYED